MPINRDLNILLMEIGLILQTKKLMVGCRCNRIQKPTFERSMEMNKNDMIQHMITYVGGKDNINNVWHCMTRLRFDLHDDTKVNKEELEKLEAVMGVHFTKDQLQVVIGTTVDQYYQILLQVLGMDKKETVVSEAAETKKGWIAWFMDVFSGVFGPIVPAIAGAGMIKGIISGFTALNLLNGASDTVRIIDMLASGVFTFLPFFCAVSAAKKFKTNEYIAAALAATLLFPTMVDAAKLGEISQFLFFDIIPVPVFNYQGSVFPIIMAVFALSHIYRIVDKHMPDVLKTVVTPTLALFITGFLTLTVIGPLGIYVGKGLALAVDSLYSISSILGGFVFGAIRPVSILFGIHHAFTPIALENFATKGYDMLMPTMFIANISIIGATSAIYFKKGISKKEKSIIASAAISGVLGITEPALFGVLTKYKKGLIACSIGAAVASAVISFFGVYLYGYILSSFFSIPAYVGPTMPFAILGWIIAFGLSFALSYIFVVKDKKN